MTLVFTDVETFSCTDLKKSNVYRYVEDPTFECLKGGWSINGGPVSRTIGERRVIETLDRLWAHEENIFVAHNATFERIVFSTLLGLPVGTYLDPARFIDTAVIAAEYGLPRKLETLAKALGAPPKDSAGTRLINLFSKPNRGKRITANDKPVQWIEFGDYMVQDVETLIGVYRRLPAQWPTEMEHELWLVNERINDRGIAVDLDLAKAAVATGEKIKAGLMEQAKEITGLKNPNSIQQLHGWLEEQGAPLENMQEETVKLALAHGTLPDVVRQVLEIRRETSLSALKKFDAAVRSINSDGRLRGAQRFFGAHTGRFSGAGVQTQNLPRLSVDNVEDVITALKEAAAA